MSLELADAVVGRYLVDGPKDIGGFRPVSDDVDKLEGTEVIEGLIYRYLQVSDETAVQLQVYLGLGELGGQLWEREVKVLMRVGGLDHPSLPTVIDGGYQEEDSFLTAAGVGEGFGYVRTKADAPAIDQDVSLTDHVAYYHENKLDALQQFWLLADGLATLHGLRIAHRNLWPGSLQFEEAATNPGLKIARFELSAVISSLLHSRGAESDARDKVRRLYLAQGPQSLLYSPPERLRFLLGANAEGDLGGPPGDVFGLGMIAAEWFLGPGAVSDVATDEFDEIRKLQNSIHDRLIADVNIPRELALLLRDMIQEHQRPMMPEVMRRISTMYQGVANLLNPESSDLPYLLVFQPDYSDRTLLRWNEIQNSARTPDGEIEVRDLIFKDVTGANVVTSANGAVDYIDEGRTVDRRRATTVIFGEEFVWFCEKYWRARVGVKTFYDEAQIIKYVVRRDRARFSLRELLITSPFARTLPMVEVITDKLQPIILERKVSGRPNWDSLLKSAPEAKPVPQKVARFLSALDFHLSYQEALVQAHRYPYQTRAAERGEAALHFDAPRDRTRIDNLPALQSKLVADDRIRPGFADFFEEAVDDGSGRIDIDVYHDNNGRPGDRVDSYPLVEVKGREQIIVDTRGRAEIPSKGWVWPSSDRSQIRALRRQFSARVELGQDSLLLSQLLGDRTIRGRTRMWAGSEGTLEGDGAGAVLDLLANEGLFALQGPPGTGKTEVTAQAVAAFLRRDQTARVLVSAQSHDALDNLALRILEKLYGHDGREHQAHRDWIALRVASERTFNRVDERMRPYRLEILADRYIADVQKRLDERLISGVLGAPMIPLVREWRGKLEQTGYEMAQRLRRGANLVFATCGGCTHEALVDDGTPDAFDWVLVEEAAKAWPTELAMPLVRGRRWTLVGDQEQIGAYARQDVCRFLDSCQGDPNEEIEAHFLRREQYLEAFDLFKSAFHRRVVRGGARQLTEQRRMREPIAEVVGRAFYPREDCDPTSGIPETSLVTKRPESDHGLLRPGWLKGHALIWLDTAGVHQDHGFWKNEYEAAVVAALIRQMQPAPTFSQKLRGKQAKTLAVITPYRDQVMAISAAVPEASAAVWTVDSFQGRQADMVILSLVRDTPRSETIPSKNIGHLVDTTRVNVALSRARDLLVIVGRFDHYANCGIPKWETVTAAIKQFGVVRAARNGGVADVSD